MRPLARDVLFAAIAGVTLATAMTVADWWKNPAGVFHGGTGTNWGFVWQTWISWFLPAGLMAGVAAALLLWLMTARRGGDA